MDSSLLKPLDIDLNPDEAKGLRYGANVVAPEQDTWLEEMLGKNTVTDFFGDMWRAGKQGFGQGATIDDALNIYTRGANISEADLQEYIQVVKQMDRLPMSDEMRDFNMRYKESGGGILGFMKGVIMNPSDRDWETFAPLV